MRRTILFLSVILISNLAHCQEHFCLGKFYNEVQRSIPSTPSNFAGRRALYSVVDTSTVVYYIFNNDICVEYFSLIRARNIDSLKKTVIDYFNREPSIKLNATFRRIDSNLYNMIIRND